MFASYSRECETAMTQATQHRYVLACNLTQAHCVRCMRCVRLEFKQPFTMETGLNANWI